MSGVRYSKSYYYNTCYYVKDLGQVYWCESSVDHGYYNNLIKQMSKIQSYEVKNEPKEKPKTKKVKRKVEKELTPQEYIMSFTKKRKSGLDMIMDAIK